MACLNSSRSSHSLIAGMLRADQLDAERVEHAAVAELHGDVEGGLAPHGRENRVGALALDDLRDDLGSEGLDVGPVGQIRVGHDGGRVRVDEDDLEPFLAERLAGLRSGVVELAGLADHDGTGADDQDRFGVGPLRHGCPEVRNAYTEASSSRLAGARAQPVHSAACRGRAACSRRLRVSASALSFGSLRGLLLPRARGRFSSVAPVRASAPPRLRGRLSSASAASSSSRRFLLEDRLRADQLHQGHLRAVTGARAEPQDARVAAVAIGVARRERLEQLLDDRAVLDVPQHEPARVQVVALPLGDELLRERPQLLGLHERRPRCARARRAPSRAPSAWRRGASAFGRACGRPGCAT